MGIEGTFLGSPSRHGNQPHITVSAHHFAIPAVAIGDECDATAVGSEGYGGVLIKVRWGIEIARWNIARFSAVEIGDENMVANIGAPFIPMSEWQARQEPNLDRIFLECFARAPVPCLLF